MSYYTLPKTNNSITIDPDLNQSMDILTPYVSHSLVNYLQDAHVNIHNFLSIDTQYTFEQLSSIINPYEHIFTKIPNTKYSVSKLKPYSNTFYDFMEISNTLSLFDSFQEKNIDTLHFGDNCLSTIECLNILREDKDDTNDIYKNPDLRYPPGLRIEPTLIPIFSEKKYHFIYYETHDHIYKNTNEYCLSLIHAINHIFNYQREKGACVIKISNIYFKPLIDILYILSSLYEKVYIIKPNTTSIVTTDKYFVCKFFTCDSLKMIDYQERLNKVYHLCMKNRDEVIIHSLVRNEIPYYFLNKIEEANIIIGQQQLEAYDQMMNILKNRNREEKIETLRKNNVQKCMHWCDKYKIPYNRFSEKINIFLPLIRCTENGSEIDFEEICEDQDGERRAYSGGRMQDEYNTDIYVDTEEIEIALHL